MKYIIKVKEGKNAWLQLANKLYPETAKMSLLETKPYIRKLQAMNKYKTVKVKEQRYFIEDSEGIKKEREENAIKFRKEWWV
jgi:hypothetical protein